MPAHLLSAPSLFEQSALAPTPTPLPCSNIACNCEQTQKQIVAEGALPVVCDMLLPGSGCSLASREAAAWLLSNLACSAEVRAQLA